MKNKETFWITNFSNMNVSLSDLNVTIKAFSSVNLLDEKHYNLTKDQLIKSAQEGSLFKKRDKINIRKVPPENTKVEILFNQNGIIPSRQRSGLVIKEDKFDELNVGDLDYASEVADLVEMDEKSSFSISKKRTGA